MRILENFDLQKSTTFGTAAKAKLYTSVKSIENIKDFIKNKPDTPVLILGGGSNMLLTQDYDGCVVKNDITGIEKIKEDRKHVWVKAGAGVIWDHFVEHCVKNDWAGVENLSLIPGTVGAAPIQNIGAYGVELKEVFDELTAISLVSGETHTFKNENCSFGYRQSIFKGEDFKGKFIITHVILKLNKEANFKISYGAIQQKLDEKEIHELSIQAIRDVVCEIRQSKLPNPELIGNAGSFFKNPELPINEFKILQTKYPEVPNYPISDEIIKVPAGWLIEQCGWKGKTFDTYGVYEKQALVIVNYGEKDGNKIKELAYQIKDSVWGKFQVHIEPEVNIL